MRCALVAGVVDDFAQNGRSEKALDGEPGGINPLGTVEGAVIGDTLSPAGDAVALSANQQDAAIVDTAKAGLEEIDQRHFDFAEGEGLRFS